MKKFVSYFFIFVLIWLFLATSSYFQIPYIGSILSSVSGSVSKIFEQRITPEELRQKYDDGLLKILIVPGHDKKSVGATFRGLKETDFNVELSHNLFNLLEKEDKFKVFITRNKNGDYKDWFLAYLDEENSSIITFRDYVKRIMSFAVGENIVTKNRPKVQHNPAADNISLNLYAINKWANDNDIDAVLHVHFNDYPTRPRNWPGKYSGFAIYVPEKQLPNSEASLELAESIKERFEKYFAKSNFPGESDTIIEDQQLIAIGSNASRNGVSVLIEYGYLYEPQFRNSELRSLSMNELALQTYSAIKDCFVGHPMSHSTTLLPHNWEQTLKKGMKGLKDVIHLQAALHKENLYPPAGKDLSDCPINGNFGSCTFSAARAFQEKYKDDILTPFGLEHGTGFVGAKTLDKLNELYSI